MGNIFNKDQAQQQFVSKTAFYDGNNIGILKSNENDFRQFSFVSLFNSLVSLFDEVITKKTKVLIDSRM